MITQDAYEALKAVQEDGESYSDIILRILKAKENKSRNANKELDSYSKLLTMEPTDLDDYTVEILPRNTRTDANKFPVNDDTEDTFF